MTSAPFAGQIDIAGAKLDPWPLPPEIVLEGKPDASGVLLSKSADSRVVRGVWDCTPGRFRWRWDYDETIVVVRGRATVSLPDGREFDLRPGTLAFFERGQDSVWTVHEPFRKAFHGDSPVPMPF